MIKILICEDISYLKHIISIQLDRIFPYIKLNINVNLKMYSFDHLRMYNIDHINTCCSRW